MTNIHRIEKKTKPFANPRKYRAPWYDTTRWRNERLDFIKEHPECMQCLNEGKIAQPSTVVDHIRPVGTYSEDKREAAFWNKDNWQALCTRHHNSKSGTERR